MNPPAPKTIAVFMSLIFLVYQLLNRGNLAGFSLRFADSATLGERHGDNLVLE